MYIGIYIPMGPTFCSLCQEGDFSKTLHIEEMQNTFWETFGDLKVNLGNHKSLPKLSSFIWGSNWLNYSYGTHT